MEITLRSLKRSHLTKHVRENRKSINDLYDENYDITNTLEFPEHRLWRRHVSKNGKYLSIKRNEKKRSQRKDSRSSISPNKRVQKTTAVIPKEIFPQRNVQASQVESYEAIKSHNKESRWFTYLISIILLIVLTCILVIIVIRKQNIKKRLSRRARWKRKFRGEPTICFESDVEDGYTGKICLCCGNKQNFIDDDRQHFAVVSSKERPFCERKKRKKKKKRKQLRSFFEKKHQKKKTEKSRVTCSRKRTRKRNADYIQCDELS